MQYNELTYLEEAGVNKHNKKLWRCKCICGKETVVIASEVRSGHTKSCGCLKGFTTHGLSKTREYQSWADMKTRCTNKNHKSYPYYGGRGITFQDSWKDFINFYQDMGSCPPSFTIERIDNNLGYTKDNCIWASRADQNRNMSRCLKYRGDKEDTSFDH